MLDEAAGMKVLRDEQDRLDLLAPHSHPSKPKEPMWFGGVRDGKAYVSYHLMPLYMNAAMMAYVPEALRGRMQGKTCFNFRKADDALFADLRALTRICAGAFSRSADPFVTV